MDSRIFKKRIQRRLYHACASDCDSDSDVDGLSTSSLPLTETCMEYFQDSFPGTEGLGRIDMPMAATVTKRNGVSPCSMVMSLMYAKRLRQRNKQYLQSMSSTDVFFISMMMASKYLYDEGVDEEVYNDEWGASVGHETEDVNQMEMDFLKEMDWHLFAKQEDFDKALTAVERRLALKEGLKRGWFTYTEMAVLLDWDPICNLWNQVGMDCTKMVSLLSAVYVASLVSMMGSAAVAIQLSGPVASATMAALLSLHTSHVSTTTTSHASHSFPVRVSCNQSSAVIIDSVSNVMTPDDSVTNVVAPDRVESLLHRTDGLEEDFAVSGGGFAAHNCTLSLEETTAGGSVLNTEIAHSGDGSTDDGATISKLKMKSASSVFSVWLFDSLISQVWSAFGVSTASSDGDTQRSRRHASGSGLSVDDEVISRTICKSCGRVEGRILNGNNGEMSATQSQTSRPASVHISKKKTDACVLCMDKMCKQGCAKGSRKDRLDVNEGVSTHDTGKSMDGSCPGCESLAALSFNSCKCSAVDCHRLRSDPMECQDPAETPHNTPLYSRPERTGVEKSDFVLPLSLMTEVPILDPVGFFTKNSNPANYVLST